MKRTSDLNTFYELLDELEVRTGGRRRLGDTHGRMIWPERGVYFFFEKGEHRADSPDVARVVRVGTHALIEKSRATLWNRLSQHRGTISPRGGNHRGSIFRLLSGQALMNHDPSLALTSWGQGSSAPRDARLAERPIEEKVSDYLGDMALVFLPVLDPSGSGSARAIIERNAIALLSNFIEPAIDRPSHDWLGCHSGRERVRKSGLWNNKHVDEIYDPDFLNRFRGLVEQTPTA